MAQDGGSRHPGEATSPTTAKTTALESSPADTSSPCVLRAAVVEFPPYAILDASSQWTGDAVELFRATARDIGCETTFIAMSPNDIVRGLERGDLDAVALPFTADPISSTLMSLTPPFATSHVGIAVFRDDLGGDLSVLYRSLTTPRQLRVYAMMMAFVILFAVVIWGLERSKNQHFRGKHREGIGSGLWWSITTLSTVGYGDKVPISATGRFFAGTWMVLSLVLVAIFTATVTSSITAHDASVEVRGVHDLPRARVGLVENGLANGYVAEHFLPHVSYPHLSLALEDLRIGNLDAVLADRHSLARHLHDLNEPRIVILEKTVQQSPISFGLRKTLAREIEQKFDAALVKRLNQRPAASSTAPTPSNAVAPKTP